MAKLDVASLGLFAAATLMTFVKPALNAICVVEARLSSHNAATIALFIFVGEIALAFAK